MLPFERYKNGKSEKGLPHIINNEIVGMVIEDSITIEENLHLIKTIDNLKHHFYHDLNDGNGFSLPGMFGQLHKTQPKNLLPKYFEQIDRFCEKVNETVGFDVNEWLQKKLQYYFSPFKSKALPGFLPYSFRVVFSKKGGLFIHKDGQLLPYIHEEISEMIQQYILPETMMSWYFTLQAPHSGGELWVADNLYDDCVKDGQFAMLKPDGTKIEVDQMKHIKIKTPTRSLLMFKGGSYWHKVLPPADDAEERITLGGFMAKSLNDNVIYFWS